MNLNYKILMCTYNGEKFIQEQLDSIKNQLVTTWKLIIYDDNSSDKTVEIIKKFISENPSLDIVLKINKVNVGYYKNFINIILDQKEKMDTFYALADQDDVWLPNKLSLFNHAYKKTKHFNKPFFYFSRRTLCTKNLSKLIISPTHNRYPVTFRHSVIQNLAGGNTIVFDNEFFKQFLKLKYPFHHIIHDWVLYSLATSIDECYIYFDINSGILYRQHEEALIGAGFSIKSFFKKAHSIISFKTKTELSLRIDFYFKNKNFFRNEQLDFIRMLRDYRNSNFYIRILNFGILIKFTKYRYNFLKRLMMRIFFLFGVF